MNHESRAQLESIEEISEHTFFVTFVYENQAFNFVPGQYVWIGLPRLMFPDLKGEKRAFSIASAVLNTNTFSVLLHAGNSGYKKTLLNLSKGEKVVIEGPFGSAFLIPRDTRSLIMIAGGIGVAPFLSILNSYKSLEFIPQHVVLITYSDAKSNKLFSDILPNLCEKCGVILIEQIGKIDLLSGLENVNISESIFFISGQQQLVDAVYEQLRSKGVRDGQMRFEQSYPSIPGSLQL